MYINMFHIFVEILTTYDCREPNKEVSRKKQILYLAQNNWSNFP